MNRQSLAALALLTCVTLVTACSRAPEVQPDEPGHAATEEEFERGSHRGRLLRDGDFAVELQIFEDGVEPEFHAYLYRANQALPPTAARLTVQLTRLGNKLSQFDFAPAGGYLKGSGVVAEPHSFSVVVSAAEGNRTHRWVYDSFEGRTTIAAATAAAAGVRTADAAAGSIADTLMLTGRLIPDQERVRQVSARFAGAIRSVDVSVGDRVTAGQRLASVESNESLQTYAVTAPAAGIVTERHANAGENTSSEPLFVLADYTRLWAELAIFPRDLARVQPGQRVQLRAVNGAASGEGRVVRVLPAASSHRDMPGGIYTVRIAIDNTGGSWTPGLFVEGTVQIGAAPVALAVKRSALQSFRDFTVAFEQIGDTYEVRMLKLGRQDDTWVEVLDGIEPGATYVTDNSYLIKADIEKAGASHDH